jgi:hypothetical protein
MEGSVRCKAQAGNTLSIVGVSLSVATPGELLDLVGVELVLLCLPFPRRQAPVQPRATARRPLASAERGQR